MTTKQKRKAIEPQRSSVRATTRKTTPRRDARPIETAEGADRSKIPSKIPALQQALARLSSQNEVLQAEVATHERTLAKIHALLVAGDIDGAKRLASATDG